MKLIWDGVIAPSPQFAADKALTATAALLEGRWPAYAVTVTVDLARTRALPQDDDSVVCDAQR